ncbi:MAG: phosphate ABC transporter substrate-binding protein PstS [Kineosporiaceae bacterium]
MRLTRSARLVGAALAGTLALAACGSDDNSDPAASDSASGSTSNAIACVPGTLNASGSSAQANAMSQWIKDYQTACPDTTVNYGAVGSGQGVTDFLNGQTSFAGSDSALNPDKGEVDKAAALCADGQAVDLPMVAGPIAVIYNVSGVTDLTMTPVVLAKIFSGKVTTWNDPAIAEINPGVSLPAETITTVHRSDASGTSDNFTKYLTAAAGADWTFDHDKQWKAPGGQGAKGSDGVAAAVKNTPNAIGYDEWSYATQNDLSYAKVDNGGGAVELTADAVGKAVAAATVSGTGDDLSLKLDYATQAPGAYPILLVTYEITCTKGLPTDQATLVKSFLSYTVSDEGQAALTDLGYAPLPAEIQTKVKAVVDKIS